MRVDELKNPKWFPKYIVLRRPANSIQETANMQETNNLQDGLEEIQTNFNNSIARLL